MTEEFEGKVALITGAARGQGMAENEAAANYSAQHPEFASAITNLLPVAAIDPGDVSSAMTYLCGTSGRYVTGATLTVDAGLQTK